ncbi:hypothetical protein C8J56DRAFT_896411 [Mycena floridula]|nr:hypothetical protein C8J56DRAFT_896411 [Mycena floridula]
MSDNGIQDDPIWGDWGRSLYNDNKGIILRIMLYYLPDPQLKTRSNARPPFTSLFSAMHEDYSFKDFLVTCCGALECADLLNHSSLYDFNKVDVEENSFTVKYDVLSTSIKGIAIRHEADFQTLVEKVSERPKPELCLYFTELEDEQPGKGDDDDSEPEEDPEEEDVDNNARRKRQKTKESTDEEEDQQEKIIQLQDTTRCEDHQCNNYTNFCLVLGLKAYHLFLLPKHFHLWSAAWSAGVSGVDEENLPNNRIFDIDADSNTNTTDINLLASQ